MPWFITGLQDVMIIWIIVIVIVITIIVITIVITVTLHKQWVFLAMDCNDLAI